ncbi:TPA: putative phage abortive infection protein [Aeromonas hydrophila]
MKNHSIIIAVLGLLAVGAFIGIAFSSSNSISEEFIYILTSAIKVFIGSSVIYLYILYEILREQMPYYSFRSIFFEKLRSHTYYSEFTEILFDGDGSHDAPNKNSIVKVFHIMLVGGITVTTVCLIINFMGDSSELGPFGDFLGGVLNPIFTFMTFFGVIITIVLQKIELKAAREEYTKSAEALSTQAIENTFFNMLNLHHKIVENLSFPLNHNPRSVDRVLSPDDTPLDYYKDTNTHHGVEAFSKLLDTMSSYDTKDETLRLYKVIQEKHNHLFGHYFRNLYQILKFIHKNNAIKKQKKKEYASILRAQLSTDELAVLFINCIGNTVDDGSFRKLLIKYQMLEHMKLELCLYGYKGSKNGYITSKDVVIADEITINEFRSKKNNGAFGNHPAQFPPLEK